MSEPTAPLYYERKVADLLGISRSDFGFLRKTHLKKNKGWRMEGRDLVLTQEGLTTLLDKVSGSLNAASLDLDFSPALFAGTAPQVAPEKKEPEDEAKSSQELEQDPDADEQEPATAAPPTDLVELMVIRIYPNYRLLQARTPDGLAVDVRVRNNKNFVPKMALRARLIAGKYEMEGRCPRTRGRY